LIFTVFFGYMLYLSIYKVKTRWLKTFIALPATFLILTIGISRIYLGAHWASDTVGGYLLGALFLIFAIKISGKPSN
jgi:undecaprenyl-diphosphatase